MKKHLKKIHHIFLTKGREIALVCALLLVVSAFLPWGYTDYTQVTGLTGDGILVIVLGLVAILFLFIKHIPLWVSLILGLAGLAIGLIDYNAMAESVLTISGNVGAGLYLLIIASAGIIIGTITEMREERNKKLKENLFYIDEEE